MQEVMSSLSTYGYIVLFFYSLGGGMVALIAAGVLSFNGHMDITISILIASVANFLGDTLLFYMGRYNKSAIMPYFKKHRRKLALSQILMKRYGGSIIVFKKFVYGLKTLVPLAIGLTSYSFVKFSIINLVASFVWGILVGIGSYLAGGYIIRAFDYMGEYPFLMPIIIATLLGLIWYYFSSATKKR